MSDYERFVSALYAQHQFSIEYDLEAMQEAVAAEGLQRVAPCVVVVAGTNGKGTVAACINAIAVAAGLRVGLYTSPHLVDFRERIRINGEPVSADACVLHGTPLFDAYSGQNQPAKTARALSYFEITTLLALRVFADEEVDIAILEVGLGGRLDATTATERDLCIITDISLDHQAMLGETIAEIASEKAGVVRHGCTTILHSANPAIGCLLPDVTSRGSGVLVCDGGGGAAERNRVLAGTAWSLMQAGTASADRIAEDVKRGLSVVQWPGRQAEISVNVSGRERTLLVDGAHNEASFIECAGWLEAELRARGVKSVPMVIGLSPGREAAIAVRAFGDLVSRYIVCRSESGNGRDAGEVAAEISSLTELPVTVADTPGAALESLAAGCDLAAVVGSLYVVGDVYRYSGYGTNPDSKLPAVIAESADAI